MCEILYKSQRRPFTENSMEKQQNQWNTKTRFVWTPLYSAESAGCTYRLGMYSVWSQFKFDSLVGSAQTYCMVQLRFGCPK